MWIFRALLVAGYRARVITIEYNRNFPDGFALTWPKSRERNKEGTKLFGASLTALEIVAHEFDYRLVYTTSFGINAYFVPLELLCDDPPSLQKHFQWNQTNNDPLHPTGAGLNPMLVVYIGNGEYRHLPKNFRMPWHR